MNTDDSAFVYIPQLIGITKEGFSRIVDIAIGLENTLFMKDDGSIFVTGKKENDVIEY